MVIRTARGAPCINSGINDSRGRIRQTLVARYRFKMLDGLLLLVRLALSALFEP